jgi:hypothetical protein
MTPTSIKARLVLAALAVLASTATLTLAVVLPLASFEGLA